VNNYANVNNVGVGEGITCYGYSDAHAYTIVKRTAKTITIQRDDAALDNWKPEIIPCGFCGHCTNQESQKYTYTRSTEYPTEILHADKQGFFHSNSDKNKFVIIGRYEFHDYNF
jgi:hypothetical protein